MDYLRSTRRPRGSDRPPRPRSWHPPSCDRLRRPPPPTARPLRSLPRRSIGAGRRAVVAARRRRDRCWSAAGFGAGRVTDRRRHRPTRRRGRPRSATTAADRHRRRSRATATSRSAAVAEAARPRRRADRDRQGLGSGFVYDADGPDPHRRPRRRRRRRGHRPLRRRQARTTARCSAPTTRSDVAVVQIDGGDRSRRWPRSPPARTSEVGQTGRRHRQPVRARPDRHRRASSAPSDRTVRPRAARSRCSRPTPRSTPATRAAPSPTATAGSSASTTRSPAQSGGNSGIGFAIPIDTRQGASPTSSCKGETIDAGLPRRVGDRPTQRGETQGALVAKVDPGQPGRRRRPRSAATSSPRSTARPSTSVDRPGRHDPHPQPRRRRRRSPTSVTARPETAEITLGTR